MDLLADEMHSVRIRRDRGTDSLFRSDFDLLGRSATAIFVIATPL